MTPAQCLRTSSSKAPVRPFWAREASSSSVAEESVARDDWLIVRIKDAQAAVVDNLLGRDGRIGPGGLFTDHLLGDAFDEEVDVHLDHDPDVELFPGNGISHL